MFWFARVLVRPCSGSLALTVNRSQAKRLRKENRPSKIQVKSQPGVHQHLSMRSLKPANTFLLVFKKNGKAAFQSSHRLEHSSLPKSNLPEITQFKKITTSRPVHSGILITSRSDSACDGRIASICQWLCVKFEN